MENVFAAAFDDGPILDNLEKIEEKIKELGKASDAMSEDMQAAFSESATAAGGLASAIDKSATAVAAQATAANKATSQNRAWLATVKESILGFQVAGKSLGEWAQQASDFAGRINLGEKALGGASGAARLFGAALKATGIGLIISLVGTLIGYFTRFQSGVDKVSRVTAGFSAVVTQLINRGLALASSIGSAVSAIGNLLTLDFDGFKKDSVEAANSFRDATDNLIGSLVTAATAAYDLEKRSQALRDEITTATVQIARQKVVIEGLKRTYEDEGKTFSARAAARKQALEVERKISDEEVDRALEGLEIAREKFNLERDNAEAKEEYVQAEIYFQDALAGRNQIIAEGEKDLRDLRKEASDLRKKQLEEEAKLLEKITKDLELLRVAATPEGLDKDLAATEKRYNDLLRLVAENEEKLLKLQAKRELSPEEVEKLQEFAKIRVELEQRKFEALQDVFKEFVDKQIELDEQLAKTQADAESDRIEARREAAKTQKDIADAQIDITEQEFDNLLKTLEAGGAKKADLERQRDELDREIKARRIQAEIAYQEKLIPLIEDGDKQQVELLLNRIAALKAELEGLSIPDNDKPKPKGNIWDFLGIEDPAQQEGLDAAFASIIDSFGQLADARLREAEAARRAADEKVRAAEDALRAEQDAAEKGFANNVDLRARELEEAKKQREAALKEEAKARKQQVLLDSAGQVSGLVTASANIFKSLSALGPIGVALAVSTIGLMFGAFAKAKADALKAAAIPKLRKGRKFDGPTHEQGNEDLVSDSGRVYAVEKDEWLIGTEPSREHDKFLGDLNAGKYRGVDLNAVGEMARSDYGLNPASEAAPRIEALRKERKDLEESRQFAALAKAYEAGVEKITAEIRRKPIAAPWKEGYKMIKETGYGTETTVVQPAD